MVVVTAVGATSTDMVYQHRRPDGTPSVGWRHKTVGARNRAALAWGNLG